MESASLPVVILCATLCVILSAFFAGLTLGVLGLDVNELELLIAAGNEDEKRNARIILPIRKQGNLLLCTLVLGNVGVTTLSGILLTGITDGIVGFVLSCLLITVFGEILPQTLCNRHGLVIGARLAPLMYFVGALLLPATYPLAWVLDRYMGEEAGMSFDRSKLRTLVSMQVGTGAGRINASENDMISALLTMGSRSARTCMTPRGELFSVRCSDLLDHALLKTIFEQGFSRIPVMGPGGAGGGSGEEACVGLLYAKDLVLVHPEHCLPVTYVVKLFNRGVVEAVDAEDTLDSVLRTFIKKKLHFALVTDVVEGLEGRDNTRAIVGIITMEDVLEYLLATQIEDEYDSHGGVASATAASHALSGTFSAASVLSLGSAHTHAMAAHLLANVEPFRSAAPPSRPSPRAMARALQSCSLLTLRPGQVCVTRRQPLPHMLLLISGALEVVSGEDGLRCSIGPWEYLGERALTVEGYAPDFGARCSGGGGGGRGGGGGGEAKVLCIPREVYQRLMAAAAAEGRGEGEEEASPPQSPRIPRSPAAAPSARAQQQEAEGGGGGGGDGASADAALFGSGLEDIAPARLSGAHHRRSQRSSAASVGAGLPQPAAAAPAAAAAAAQQQLLPLLVGVTVEGVAK